MDIMSWIQSLLSPGGGMPPAGPPLTPGSAPTLGGAPATPGTGILGGPPTGESLLGSALRGLAGSFAAGGGGGGTLGQIGRGISGGVQAVDEHKQQKLRDYYLNRQFAQQDATDAKAKKQAEMLAKIPAPNGMNPQDWESFKQAAPDQALALYSQSVKPEKPTHSAAYTEWQDAQANGFTGSFTDYQNADANRHRSTTQINLPKAPPTIEERDQAVLLRGDPGSPEYAMAYNRTFQTPRFVPGTDAKGNPTIVPIMPTIPQGIRPPSFGGQAPAAGAPPADASIDLNNTGAAAAASSDAVPMPPATPQGPVTIPQTGGFGTPGATGDIPMSQAAPGAPRVGPAIQVGSQPKGQTEDARKNQQLYERSKAQLPIVLSNFDSLATLGNQMAGKVPVVGNAMTSGPAQEATNALLDITASYLYSVSGATANPGEVANLARTVMPQIGDQPATLADKKARLQQMVDSIATRAGNATPAPADVGRSVSGGNVAGGILGTTPTKIQGDADYNALPPGAHFVGPDGIERVKP